MRNGRQKIPSKREAYALIEQMAHVLTLDEIAKRLGGISRQRAGQLRKEAGVNFKHNKWHQVKSDLLPSMN